MERLNEQEIIFDQEIVVGVVGQFAYNQNAAPPAPPPLPQALNPPPAPSSPPTEADIRNAFHLFAALRSQETWGDNTKRAVEYIGDLFNDLQRKY